MVKTTERGLKTREKLLKQALKLFSHKGFAATSVSAITKKTGVTKSNFYHHFSSKEDIWVEIKTTVFDAYIEKELKKNTQISLPYIDDNEEFFLKKSTPELVDKLIDRIFNERYLFYQSNPLLVRMLIWQSLEEEKSQVFGDIHPLTTKYTIIFEGLQNKGLLSDKYPAQQLLYMLFVNSASWFFGFNPPLHRIDKQKLAQNKAVYKEMLLDMTKKLLRKNI